ncbi:hypothetical protein ACFV27_37105 [Streptomyces antimycoticus]|uniref:hypothetical protein n=1 Tax=Streptomyces antimycoticus TaxID=68175 RepID=UPI003689952D
MDLDDDTWIEQGQKISNASELREYVAAIRAEVHHMQTGLARAAAGALNGRSWLDTPGDERASHGDVLHEQLDMTVTPAGMAAKDAVYRQSLAALLVALEAVDRATLTVWLADISAKDPNRPA